MKGNTEMGFDFELEKFYQNPSWRFLIKNNQESWTSLFIEVLRVTINTEN